MGKKKYSNKDSRKYWIENEIIKLESRLETLEEGQETKFIRNSIKKFEKELEKL